MQDDVDDTHDVGLQVIVHDKENHVIELGKLRPSMDEFRMCFSLMQSRRSLTPILCELIKRSFM
jgi:hypothetical protein